MDIVRVDDSAAARLAPLLADFRVTLRAFRSEEVQPDAEAAREELLAFLREGFPVYAAMENDEYLGYLVCRIDEPCLWVEQLYVRPEHRRKGAASLLFRKAEELAGQMGEDTVFNYVHPNNEAVIRFLRSQGYTVLNMIEIRKPYKGEKLTTKIRVQNNSFDY